MLKNIARVIKKLLVKEPVSTIVSKEKIEITKEKPIMVLLKQEEKPGVLKQL